MKKLLLSFLATCCLMLTNCSDDDDFIVDNNDREITNPQTPEDDEETVAIDLSENFGAEVSKDFSGQIMDVNYTPIEGAEITIGEETTLTDANGVFLIDNASVFENFAYIKVSKAGYINGSRTVIPTEGTNHITVMLLEKNATETIQSGTSAVVTISNGASVEFEGNYINNATKETYTGSVKVSLHYLDPTAEDMTIQMPGMLYAANSENEERMLQTFGMIAVELEGDNGEKLNLAEVSTATIHMPVSTELISGAPTSIPLWYFDEEKGYWIEDGEATLQGNEYVGTVSHFSFWNCDIPAEAVNYCLTVTNENSEPIADTKISIASSMYGTTYGFTNADGEVCGIIPMEESLTLSMYNGSYYSDCSTIFYASEIGPFTQDTEETVSVEVPDEIEASINATILDCDGNFLEEGYVILDSEYYWPSITTIENGNFTTSLLMCNEDQTIELEAINTNTFETSGELSYTLEQGYNDLGSISSCANELEEFISYGDIIFIEVSASFDEENNKLGIGGSGEQGCLNLEGYLNEELIGSYNSVPFPLNVIGFTFIECPFTSDENTNITFEVTSFGEVGEYIDINFAGDYEDYQGNQITITNGTMHVIRDE